MTTKALTYVCIQGWAWTTIGRTALINALHIMLHNNNNIQY